jgi:hypothetical protein
VETESYRVARDYMVRIGARDFLDETSIMKLAQAGHLMRSEFLSRFGKYAHS